MHDCVLTDFDTSTPTWNVVLLVHPLLIHENSVIEFKFTKRLLEIHIISTCALAFFQTPALAMQCYDLFLSKPGRLIEFDRAEITFDARGHIFGLPLRLFIGTGDIPSQLMAVERFEASDHIGDPITKSTGPLPRGIAAILQALYSRFANQGPERNSIVQKVMAQDHRELSRIIHFLAYDYQAKGFSEYLLAAMRPEQLAQTIRPWMHLQVLLSHSPNEKLHVEDEVQIDRVSPNEVIVEIGRLTMNDQINTMVQAGQIKRQDLLFIKLRFFHALITWLRQHKEIRRAFFQVNKSVHKALLQLGLPLHLARPHKFSKSYDGSTDQKIEEFVFEIDRESFDAWDTSLIKKIIGQQIKTFLSAPDHESKLLKLVFKPDDVPLLELLGLVGRGDIVNTTAWQVPEKHPHSKARYEMRALPRNYPPPNVNSSAFATLEATRHPIYIFYNLDNGYYGMKHLRTAEPIGTGPIYILDGQRLPSIQYISLYIPVDIAQEISRRFASP